MMKNDKFSIKFDTDSVDFNDVKSPLELINIVETEPEVKKLWGGVEEVSFGYIFGPSKAGKTIFSENLAISLALGRETFFEKPLIGKSKKVMIAAMEEDYRNRSRRLAKQISNFTDAEKQTLNDNISYAGKRFPRFLSTKEDWNDFESCVLKIQPEVLVIDSFTRIMDSDITNREECKKVLKRLRYFAYENNICVILIHHSTKNQGKPLSMDSMAGSSILSQEADFSIGINVNDMTKSRYVKEVFYRYEEASEKVISFKIDNETNWLEAIEETFETSMITYETQSLTNYDLVLGFLKNKSDKTVNESFEINKKDFLNHFVETNTMPERTLEYNIHKAVKNNILVKKGVKGNYLCHVSQLTQQA